MEKVTEYSIADKLSSISSQVKSDMKHYLKYTVLSIIHYSTICSNNHFNSTNIIIEKLSKIFERWCKNQLDLLGRSHVFISLYKNAIAKRW